MLGVGRATVIGSVVLFVLGCRSPQQTNARERHASAAPQTSAVTPVALPALTTPYPRAAWRSANADAIDRTVLWFSQILIRHADARETVSFSLSYWASVLPRPTRSRAEAFALAQQISERVATDPTQFADLARHHSDELPSKDEGGAVGGYPSSLLELWPQVLDALAALRPGQSSRVVETRHGFHVFYRSAPPPGQVLSGEHILIGHQQAPWGNIFARNEQATRTRDEALALAIEVFHQAQAAPSRFRELVETYSEHNDAAIGGDFGAWSTREPNPFPTRMKRLQELATGEIGAPIETHLGFEIIRRTPQRHRMQYRANLLVFPVDELNSAIPTNDPGGRAHALAKANGVAQLLSRDPTRFNQLGAEQMERQWQEGREFATLSDQLHELAVGQISAKPAASEYGYLIAQRLEPEAVQSVEYLTELPSSSKTDFGPSFKAPMATDDSEPELGF
jgi:hypothetical protein